MIKEFNISTSANAFIRGEHYADVVYVQKDVKLYPGDITYGILFCNNIVFHDEPNPADLNPDDRIYKGILHCRDVVIKKADDEEFQA